MATANAFGQTYQPPGLTDTGFTPVPTIGGGTTYPTSWGSTDVNPRETFYPNPVPNSDYSNAFLPANMTANLFNLAGVSGNLGTMMGSVAPQATNFLQGMFNPGLNPMEQNFAQASLYDNSHLMNQAMLRAEGQFENSPFHSSLPQVYREIMNDTTNNTAKNFSQMALQRQQLSTSLAPTVFDFPIKAADVGAQAGERLFNISNQAYAAPYQIPLSLYNQIPTPGPVVTTGGGGQSGGKL